MFKSVGVSYEQTFDLKHHTAYIRPALQMENDGEIAADARSQMVYAVPATDGKSYYIKRISESP